MVEANTQSGRVNGHLHLQAPRDALERGTPKLSDPPRHDETVTAAG